MNVDNLLLHIKVKYQVTYLCHDATMAFYAVEKKVVVNNNSCVM